MSARNLNQAVPENTKTPSGYEVFWGRKVPTQKEIVAAVIADLKSDLQKLKKTHSA